MLSPKLHSIQLLRAVAALLVAVFHAQQAFARRFAPPAFEHESYLFAFGAVGVHVFFVISGFIMVYTSRFEKGFDAPRFFRRRFLRIYPIYWICAALYLLGHWLLGQPYDLGGSEIVGALVLWPGDAAAIIGPAWTLAYEMFFYVCFGLAMIWGLHRGMMLLAAGFASAIAAGIAFPAVHPALALASSPLLLEFLAGAAIGWLLATDRLPRRGGLTMIAVACALFVIGILVGYAEVPLVLSWGIPSVLLVGGLVMAERARGAHPAVVKLGHFGDSSYALYLLHILVITLAIALAYRVPTLASVEPALISLPIALLALALGEILHHKIERPLLKRLNPRRPLIPVDEPRIRASELP